MSDQSIACPSCGKKIPLTRALRAEIESSVREQYEESSARRERELRAEFETELKAEQARVRKEAALIAERESAREMAAMKEQLQEQAARLTEARRMELEIRKRERELATLQQEIDLTVARKLDDERTQIITEAQKRVLDEHRLKDAEKERQLADMRRQIEHLKRKADQGSQQLQGEAGEDELEGTLRALFPLDEINAISQGVRGADLQQLVMDGRGTRAGAILWECKNARNWSDTWIEKLKADQRAMKADVAVLVTASLPRGCSPFTLIDGVLVTGFACAGPVANILRAHLLQLTYARSAALNRGEKLELLHRYLSGVEFRQRVEAIVDAFERMREDLEQERRAAERQWARRTKQIEAVTYNISGMYGDLQGLVPGLPAIQRLELPAFEDGEQGLGAGARGWG